MDVNEEIQSFIFKVSVLGDPKTGKYTFILLTNSTPLSLISLLYFLPSPLSPSHPLTPPPSLHLLPFSHFSFSSALLLLSSPLTLCVGKSSLICKRVGEAGNFFIILCSIIFYILYINIIIYIY
jgi:hypothetical protein